MKSEPWAAQISCGLRVSTLPGTDKLIPRTDSPGAGTASICPPVLMGMGSAINREIRSPECYYLWPVFATRMEHANILANGAARRTGLPAGRD
jgi:hypothetical protein